MGIEAPAEVKYHMIHEAVESSGSLLHIAELCRIAGVSRSGYYAWKGAEEVRVQRDECDRADYELILEAYQDRGYDKGARGIHMRLLHMGVRMNLKKIRRLMKKYGLKCPIRKANPYRRMAKALKTNRVAKNIVNRDFHSKGVRKVLLTDISYLFYANGRCFISTIIDAKTHEILGYRLSQTPDVKFVLETVDTMIKKHGSTLDSSTIVHSDQGFQYTSNEFIRKLRDAQFVQSMSRRGNCWDNAPQESFFGHMKDEIAGRIATCSSFEAVQHIVDDWIDYYNNERYQWDLRKLAPTEYYEYLCTGIYPLPIWEPSKDDELLRGSAPHPEV